jgi:hypothetical protein
MHVTGSEGSTETTFGDSAGSIFWRGVFGLGRDFGGAVGVAEAEEFAIGVEGLVGIFPEQASLPQAVSAWRTLPTRRRCGHSRR